MTITEKDRATLQARGITEEQFAEEVRHLRDGFPYLKVQGAATVGNGILSLDESKCDYYVKLWDKYLGTDAKVVKMVPASGAASRMFKNLFSFVSGESDKPDSAFVIDFFDGLHEFAFFDELNNKCLSLYGKDVDMLISEGGYRDVVKALIDPEGLNYGQLPKALLDFHSTADGVRTAMEEHLAEGTQYAAGDDGTVHVHFTISPEHKSLFEDKVQKVCEDLSKKYGVRFDVSTSIQKPSTDTVALTSDNEVFRLDGNLFFRPGGHGALIENLSDIEADVIFLKNIDNVVPDSNREQTIRYKKVLGGILVEASAKISEYIGELSVGLPSRPVLNEMLDYLHDTLCVREDGAETMDNLELADYLMCKFSRPLRVCGMVRNEGEPGGGPFLVYGADGTVSPQILESTQIDTTTDEGKRLLKESTHFNPVDIVCDTTDHTGEKYDLREYVDSDTGFISSKSVKGVDIKALELPGLWNGAMSDWNTIFVEVPGDTFNPVKTVNDLLRPAHQGKC